MTPIFCVSYPRAGCTWFAECMRRAIGEQFHYCEGYSEIFDPAKHNFLKSHDFGQDHEPPKGFVPILQMRDRDESVASYFLLKVRGGEVENTRAAWDAWSPEHYRYWDKLLARWYHRAAHTIWMDSLVWSPYIYIRDVARLMTGNHRWQLSSEFVLPEWRAPETFEEFPYPLQGRK